MGYYGEFQSWTIAVQEDMRDTTPGTGALYKGVNMRTGLFDGSGEGLFGLLQTAVGSQEHGTLAIYGISKAVFATAINTIGLQCTLNSSGFMTLAGSGDYVYGHNVTTVSCYAVAAAAVNFLNPWRRTN